MLTSLGRFAVRRAKLVLIGTLVFFLAAGAIGGGVAEHLSSGGFEDPNQESVRAEEFLEEEFGAATPNVILLVTVSGGTVDDPAVAAAGLALTDELSAVEGVEQVASYWSLGNAPPLKNRTGDRALIFGLETGDEDEQQETAEFVAPAFNRSFTVDGGAEVTVNVGGFNEVFRDVGHRIERDLAKAELVAGVLTLALLVFVFGTVVSALLPLAVGGFAIVGSFLVLRVLSELTLVSVFSLSLTTAMGLGLAIDYSLFIVSRYREELARGLDVEDAVVRTVETAGRTVLFSGLTVAVSLSALLIFPLAFFRSFAYGGIPVVMLASAASIVSLPAGLALLGDKVERLKVREPKTEISEDGLWHRMAVTVMKRPLVVAVPITIFLLALGAPFLRIELGLPDDRVLPPGAEARIAQDVIRAEFDSKEAGAIPVVVPDAGDPMTRQGEIVALAQEYATLDGVSRVDHPFGIELGPEFDPSTIDLATIDVAALQAANFERLTTDDDFFINIVPSIEPVSPEGEALARTIRNIDTPFEETLVGGQSAFLVDAKNSTFQRMPLGFALIGIATFVLLFLMSGSILVPIKALVLNILSLSAVFGASVWIFQDGNLSGFFDFTPTGTLALTSPVLMFCVAFGLSMDYEVFLISRIKEEHDRTGDNEQAVALGLERTGRIVTAAALLISIVFVAMALMATVSFVMLFGTGLAIAVLGDAFLVRGTLVPAFMRLAGEANWWAPAPLKKIYDKYGLKEAPDPPMSTWEIEEPPDDLADLDAWVNA